VIAIAPCFEADNDQQREVMSEAGPGRHRSGKKEGR
jgi:hypothetical protein